MHQDAALSALDALPPTSGVLAARLTARQRRFADNWLAEPNASKAARSAGYKQAANEGSLLLRLPHVRAYIDARIREGSGHGLAPLRNNIIETYWSIASADIRDIVSVTQEDDHLCIRVRASAEWTDKIAQAVAEVVGQAPASTQSVKIKMHDKLEALGKLAKITGLIKKEPSGFGVHVPPGGSGPPVQLVEVVVRYVEPPTCRSPRDRLPRPPYRRLAPLEPRRKSRSPPPRRGQPAGACLGHPVPGLGNNAAGRRSASARAILRMGR